MTDKWVELSEVLLSSCLRGDRDDGIAILYTNAIDMHDIVNEDVYRDIYIALSFVLQDPNGSPTPTSLAHANPNLIGQVDRIRELSNLKVTVAESLDAAKIIKEESSRHYVATTLNNAINEFNEVNDIEVFRSQLISNLNKRFGGEVSNTTAKGILAEIKAGVTAYGKATPTGFSWLDKALKGGLRPGRHIAIGGGEKSRKTTWARNIISSVLRRPQTGPNGDYQGYVANPDVSVCFLGFENDRHITTLDFSVMIAMEHMYDNYRKQLNKTFKGVRYHEWIDSELIIDEVSNRTLGRLPSEIVESVEYGMDIMETLNLTVNDTTKKGGDLSTLTDMARVINFHNAAYRSKGQLLVVCTDYLTLIKVTGIDNPMIAQNEVVNWLTKTSPDLEACMITLAQFNRSSVTSRLNGEEIDVMGTHGSSELERGTQNYMDVAHPSPFLLNVRMRRSRRGAAGLNEMQSYYLHPSSGVILGTKLESHFKIGE
jgi:hypothetical protein